MTLSTTSRLGAAQQTVQAAGIDALFVTPGADLRYLTGYPAIVLERLTCLVVPRTGDPVLVVPALEEPAAQASPAADLGIEILPWQETDDPFLLVADRLSGSLGEEPRRVAVANRMWAEHALRLQAALPGVDLQLGGPILRALRIRKGADEVASLRAAGAAIDRVHARMAEWLRPGRTEAQVGRDIADAIVAEGHESVEFTIVGSGPNSASPHHHLSERVIERGDVVVVDIGGVMPDGYCSDSTRTYLAGGEPDEEFQRLYQVLALAQDMARRGVRPRIPAERVDEIARDLITGAGYGEHFIHRTGHGIGLEAHEDPYIVAGNSELLQAGMAFSIEPGIYLPGRYGARIEDIVVVTEFGVESMNETSRDLVVVED